MTTAQPTIRPSIFLYTDAAQISDDARAAMRAALEAIYKSAQSTNSWVAHFGLALAAHLIAKPGSTP